MTAEEWATLADLGTALGTLVLAAATFASVRSSNLMARVAQQQLLIDLRPVLTASRREDPTLKVNFGDLKWVQIPGGGGVGEVGPGDGSQGDQTSVVYLAIALRNAGNGIAVLHGWRFFPDAHRDEDHAPLEEFQRQNRDLYIAVGEVGFWQGAFRDTSAPGYAAARKAVEAHEPWTVELLYADHEGGQRAVSQPPGPGRRRPAGLARLEQPALEHRPAQPSLASRRAGGTDWVIPGQRNRTYRYSPYRSG